MDRFESQENQADIRKLRRLLKSVPSVEKKEDEWQLLENDLFARLDRGEQPHSDDRDHVFSKYFAWLFQGGAPALRYAGAFVLLCVLGILFWNTVIVPDNLKYSRVIGLSGDVVLHAEEDAAAADARREQLDFIGDKPAGLYKNQVIETGEDATLFVQIDQESHLVVSRESRLTVRKANTRNIELFLHHGEILCSVGKRKKYQSFTVVTPNTVSNVIGTVFRVSTFTQDTDKRTTDLFVVEGEVEISNHEKYLGTDIVKTGQRISVSNRAFSQVQTIDADQMPIHTLSIIKLLKEQEKKNQELRGVLDIATDPQGAEVVVKNNIVGKTPLMITYPAGTYAMTLRKDGFELWTGTVDVVAREISFVNASLSTNNVVTTITGDSSTCSTAGDGVSRKRIRRVKKRPAVIRKSGEEAEIMNPAFVEALVQMTIGEFQKALVILDSLKDLPEIGFTEKIRIVNKISECYKGMGNFDTNLERLTKRYHTEKNLTVKGNLLWEIIIVRANCLGDYDCAEKDLLTYIKRYPNGGWIEPAYMKLGEIRYMSDQISKAVDTYRQYVTRYPSGRFVDNAVYLIANIQRLDQENYKEAIKWYSRLIERYPQSNYRGNAIFERAECYRKQKQFGKARKDYQMYIELFPDGHLRSFCLSFLDK